MEIDQSTYHFAGFDVVVAVVVYVVVVVALVAPVADVATVVVTMPPLSSLIHIFEGMAEASLGGGAVLHVWNGKSIWINISFLDIQIRN